MAAFDLATLCCVVGAALLVLLKKDPRFFLGKRPKIHWRIEVLDGPRGEASPCRMLPKFARELGDLIEMMINGLKAQRLAASPFCPASWPKKEVEVGDIFGRRYFPYTL